MKKEQKTTKRVYDSRKVTITFDELTKDGKAVAFTNMDDSSLFLYELAKRKDLPAIIVDCQHLKPRKAQNIINHPVFRQLIVENIDRCEKLGLCVGFTLNALPEKDKKDGNK